MVDDGGENAVEQTLTRLRALDTRYEPAPVAAAPRTLADLYRDHRMRMVRLAVLLVDDPSTAEDVVQEAFAGPAPALGEPARRGGRHRLPAHGRGQRLALGAAAPRARPATTYRRTRSTPVPPSRWRCCRPSTRPSSTRSSTLPPRQREVLVLRYYGGLSEAEIAEATGITRGTVKSTASRALDAVGRAMNPGAG